MNANEKALEVVALLQKWELEKYEALAVAKNVREIIETYSNGAWQIMKWKRGNE